MKIKAVTLFLIAAIVLIPMSVSVGNLLLSNGLMVDDNNRVMAVNNGTIALITSLGFPVDSSGNLVISCQSGCSGGAGTPPGSDTQVVFNDQSAFGADAGMTYNKTTDTLTVGILASGSGTGSWQATEGSDPSLCAANKDTIWADSTNHVWRSCLNNGSSEYLAQSTAVRPADATKYLDGSGAWSVPAGGGSSASAFIIVGGTGSTSGISANTTKMWGVTIAVSITGATKIGYDVATADNSGNLYDLGIYDSSGTRICHTGAVAGTTLAPSTGHKVNSLTASCNIPAGDYYLAMTGNAGTFILGGQANWFSRTCASNPSSGSGTSGGALNASVTPQTPAMVSCTVPALAFSTL